MVGISVDNILGYKGKMVMAMVVMERKEVASGGDGQWWTEEEGDGIN